MMMSNPLLRGVSDEHFIPIPPLNSGGLKKATPSFRAGRRVCHKSVKTVHKQFDASAAQKQIQRAGRFATELAASSGRVDRNNGVQILYTVSSATSAPGLICGQNTALEKQYLRLCGAADPAFVRPPYILRKSFVAVMTKFFEAGTSSASSYRYIDEQLRSIRQDYLVQGVYDHHLFFVYYFNSLISLIHSDLGQFNQCVCQLGILAKKLSHEFADTRFHSCLYSLVNGLEMRKLPSDPALAKFMTDLRKSLDSSNLAKLFRTARVDQVVAAATAADELEWLQTLFVEFRNVCTDESRTSTFGTESSEFSSLITIVEKHWARIGYGFHGLPFMSACLLRIALPRWRARYLLLIFKSQHFCDVEDLARWLRFPDVPSCVEFLRAEQATFSDAECRNVDCAASYNKILQSSLLGSKNKAMG